MLEKILKFFLRKRKKVRKRKKKTKKKAERELLAKDLMTKNVIYTKPTSTLYDVARILLKHKITGMPVMSKDKLVGEISEKDLMRITGKESLVKFSPEDFRRLRRIKTREVMKKPIWVYDETPITKVVEIMRKHKIRRVIVLNREKKLVGILTKTDLMTKLSKEKIKEKVFTKIDEMLRIIEKNKSISISKLSKKLNMPVEIIESWAKILEDHDLIDISYPTVGSPILKIKPKVE